MKLLTNTNNHIKSHNQKKKILKETKWCVPRVSEACWLVCDDNESVAVVCVFIVTMLACVWWQWKCACCVCVHSNNLVVYFSMQLCMPFFINLASVCSPKFNQQCWSSQAYANSQNSAIWCVLGLAIWWFQNLIVWSCACCFSPHNHALSTYLSTINNRTQSVCLPNVLKTSL